MALNKNSNLYTIIYTIVMVVIVGALLSAVATLLKDKQGENVLNEQKESIMKAFGAEGESFDKVTVGYITDTDDGAKFNEVQKDKYSEVFDLISNRKALAAADNELPIFMYKHEVAEKDGNKHEETLYVIPLVGKGLWGDIWGYMALKPVTDNIEVVGVIMDHASETPGLGAEIATPGVQNRFKGQMIYAGSDFKLRMIKNGKDGKDYVEGCSVDAISGGTKTCDGVNAMLEDAFKKYEAYFKTL